MWLSKIVQTEAQVCYCLVFRHIWLILSSGLSNKYQRVFSPHLPVTVVEVNEHGRLQQFAWKTKLNLKHIEKLCIKTVP